MSVGKRIRKVRTDLGLSQVDFANAIGVTKQTLYKYENDLITNIPSDKIEAAAKIGNVSPAFLMGWDDSDNKSKNHPQLTPDESELLEKYMTLNQIGRAKAREYISDLSENEKYTKDIVSQQGIEIA